MGEGFARDNPSPIIVGGRIELPSLARGEGAIMDITPAASIAHSRA
jgi:hypothetical protein